ncbi:hypothetical protein V8C35DRAFT_302959 [Trichoderma chlorosporum]
MAADTQQESLLELWESIPGDLRPSGSYSFHALSSAIASLVAKASQCGHKDELANALGGVRTTNGSWQDLLELTRQAAWQSSQELMGDMPKPFTGSAADYRRWKSGIKNWAIVNGAVPGDTIAAAVLLNMTGPGKQWASIRQPSQYSKIDGVPVTAVLTLEAILVDMDKIFIDTGASQRAFKKYSSPHQGTQAIMEYNVYFNNLVGELAYHNLVFSPSNDISQYINSLRPDLKKRMEDWRFRRELEEEPLTLTECLQKAAHIDAYFPATNKGRQQTT